MSSEHQDDQEWLEHYQEKIKELETETAKLKKPKLVLTLMVITIITLAILFYYSYSSYLHDFHEGVPSVDTRGAIQ